MNILYHHRSLLDGAEGIHVTSMVRAFEALGHDVTMACPGAARGAAASTRLGAIRHAVPQFVFEMAAAAHSVLERQSGTGAITRSGAALLYKRHALNDVGMLEAARASGVPAVLEVNALYTSRAMVEFEPLRFERFARRMERRALELATVVITVSSPLKDLVEQLAPGVRSIVVLPNGADPDLFDPQTAGKRIRKRHGVPDGALVAGWSGIMRPWHGLNLLLEAVRATEWFVLFIGSGPDRERVERLAREQGVIERIRFAGRVPAGEMPEHLAAIDVGVVADDRTRYASPMKLLEYMAMGKPVVAPDLTNIRDVVAPGVHGLLFAPGDARALGRQLAALQDSGLRSRLGAAGRAAVETTRNWSANARRVLRAVEDAQARSVRPAVETVWHRNMA